MASSDQRSPARKNSILIVCPYTLVREGLRLLLAQDEDLYVVGVAADASQALESMLQIQPDVILAAYSDGYSGGTQNCAAAVKSFKTDRPDLPVLVVSPDIHPERIQTVLAAGATGYLPLDSTIDELVRAVNTVVRGELTLHPAILLSLLSYQASQDAEDSQPNLNHLSPREQEILTYLARGLCDRDIAQALFISVRTVQSHLAHIYAKLGVHSRTEAALITVRAGWFSPPNGDSVKSNNQ